MRFGIVMRDAPADARSWRDRVARVADAGAHVVLMPDHLGMPAPVPPLVAAAAVDARLRVGTQVLNVNFWHPAVLARDAVTVDLLTDGRLELGFGAGHAAREFAAAGIDYERPARRIDRLEAVVGLVRRLLAGDAVSATGPYRLDECAIGLRPHQDRIPIMVGGNGDRVLRVAAEQADIVSFVGFTSGTEAVQTDLTHFTWSGLADRVAHVERCSGVRSDPLERSVLVQRIELTDDRRAAVARFVAGSGVDPAIVADSPFALWGSRAAVVAQLQRLRDELGVTYVTTFEDSLDALAAVLEASPGARARS